MKILITGKHSYIGNSVKSWLNDKEPLFLVDEVSLRNMDLNTISFKGYDVIIHVAGIAHNSSSKKLTSEYLKINKNLAIEVANKAKNEEVKQFIFTSTMAIYGADKSIGDFKPVDIFKPSPTSYYGKSKLEADLSIQKLQSKNFNVVILRLPMVYGNQAKGNFYKLVNISNKISVFPKIKNIRSVLNIKNLSELIRLLILNDIHGVFFPQDQNFFNTTDFIVKIRMMSGKKTILIPHFSMLLGAIGLFVDFINKIYGNKFYEFHHSKVKNLNYQISSIEDFLEEIKLSNKQR